jgi:hypothetical protein
LIRARSERLIMKIKELANTERKKSTNIDTRVEKSKSKKAYMQLATKTTGIYVYVGTRRKNAIKFRK